MDLSYKIILASSNKGKIKEIKSLLPFYEVIAYSEILGSFEIVEDGTSFKENAIIKAKAVDERLKNINYKEKYIVIADDSGITVPILNNEPGIYSARYAGVGVSDKQNNLKLISKLKEIGVSKTKAYYTACLAIAHKNEIYTTHGWMYGEVIDHEIGDNGFGYDPLFIPQGQSETLGVLQGDIKKQFGHRSKGLDLALKVINSILK